MRQSRIPLRIQARAMAAPGLLARLASVLNPHPVTGFEFTESPDGLVTLTVCVDPDADARADWHVQRVSARLRRVVGVTSVSVCLDGGRIAGRALLPTQPAPGGPTNATPEPASGTTPGERVTGTARWR